MSFDTTRPPTPDEMLAEKGFLTNFWKRIFLEAQRLNASDIHIESLKSGLQVRLRVKGSLISPFEIIQDRSEMVQFVDKFKEISGLDTSNKKVLQDSSFSLDLTTSTYRVSLSPGFQYGECVVLRIINNDELPSLERMALPASAKDDMRWALSQKQGLFLVTGPTGSGKSTTLQACIAAMSYHDKKIISIENPPERILPGVVHECITSRFGWKEAIKGAMREDPDVILVGEIRDHESAKLAVEASQTGHLVLSTLHTNNVPATITRLLTLGIEKHLIADALLFISAQRLLKVLCVHCKQFEGDFCKKGQTGCAECQGTGYSGRIPILEYCLTPDPDLVFNFDHKVFSRILRQDLTGETRRLIKEGIVDHRLLPTEDTQTGANVFHIKPRETRS